MDWQRVVATALIGTDRQRPLPPTGDSSLAQWLAQLDWQSPEKALLDAVSALALHRQVGTLPQTTSESLPSGCSLEDWPPCSAETSQHLVRILTQWKALHPLLPELLELMAAAQQRLPEVFLPKLLQTGAAEAAYRDQTLAVVGRRGHWLAQQNPDWAYATFDRCDPLASVHAQTPAVRAVLLQQWRQQDPAAARDVIAARSGEPAKERERLLTTLQTGLSNADEPFLEATLDDRSQPVRQLAADLLAQLPESRLAQRMAERAQACMQLSHTRKKFSLTIVPPQTIPADWTRDGIPHSKKAGKRAEALTQLIGRTPLSAWSEEPAALIAAAQENHWQSALLQGWAKAAVRQNNAAWAEALLDADYAAAKPDLSRTALLAAMPPGHQTAWLMNHRPEPTDARQWLDWLQAASSCAGPWSTDFSQILLNHIQQSDRMPDSYLSYHIQALIAPIAIALPFSFAPTLQTTLGRHPSHPRPAYGDLLEEILSLLKFRQAFHHPFKASS
ncbi:MAG: hypothetical protein F6J97_09095 [Leptolyngbya sp. SIO4C1]|nr:hypothetical protein [Leptolyngbya sp. SIO4C1]